MVGRKLLLGSFALAALAGTADAGVFSRSKSKDGPKPSAKPAAADRADAAAVLRGDPDERHRIAAANELGKSDLRQNPQAAEALVAALRQDPSQAVRAEAAEALGRLRPLTLQAGQALEDALTADTSPRVRAAARAAIGVYLQAGYRIAPASPATAARQPATAGRPTAAKKSAAPQRPNPASRQTGEPPLADAAPGDAGPVVEPQPLRPLPPARDGKRTMPAKPAKPEDDGPILIGPG